MKGPFFLIVTALCLSASSFAADSPVQMEAGAGKNKVMEWMKYTVPGEGHKVLKDMAGRWNFKLRWWAAPGAKPEESKGSGNMKWVLGGRFLQQEMKGTAMGQPFYGMGFTGFDALREEYQSVWMDNLSTAMMVSSGTYDAATKTLKEMGSGSDPMSGDKNKPFRTELKLVSKNERTFEMYTKGSDGNEYKCMEIHYMRAK